MLDGIGMMKNREIVILQGKNAFIIDRNETKYKKCVCSILILLISLLSIAGPSFAAPATPNDNWKLVFDPAIDQPNNYSSSFTPRVLLYNQGGNPVSGATVTYTYFDVNGNTQIATGTATGSGNSYSGAAINMINYAGKYINVLFSVSAGSNTLQEQHVFFAGESNAAHGAIWKIEVFNTSIGPSWNGNSNQKIYMKLYSDAGIPFRNNFDIPTIAIWDSLHTVVQAATAMTYEEDGVYSYNISGYANREYYFEIYNQWSGAPTGSTKGSKKYTKSYAGFYLEANNSQGDESAPEIVSVERKPYFPVDDDFVNITVHAVDNVNLAARTLYFTVNNQTVQTKSMNALTGIEYRATLDPYLLEDNIRYNVTISDGTNIASSAEYMYNVQDNRGTPNMSHSFLNHPVYWFGKSRQASFVDNGGDTNYDGVYTTTEKDNVAYLAVNKDYEFFKDMTRIKVQTIIMDQTGKPVQHLTNVKAWLSNNTTQTAGTHNREKSMTEVPGESGVYSVTWEGSANVSGSNLVWNDDAKAIWGRYTSGEIYSVYIDVNNDGQPEENLTWLAYNFGDTFWGSAEAGKTWDSHSDIETPGMTCGRTSCHDMVGGLTTRTLGDPACPDCHGVYKNANGGTFPVNSGTTAQKDAMIYGNSTSHPRRNNTNATYCGDETCHNVAWGSSSAPLPAVDIPGYPAGTRLNGTFRAEYPNPMQCAEHHNYKGGKIPVEEGHNRMVACKYCHGGSHDNNKLLSYEVSINGTNKSNVDRGTPGYVGAGGVNGSGNYAGNCYTGCHRVQVEHSLTGKPGGAAENKFVPCDECHKDYNNAPMHQESLFPYDNRSTCGACHQDKGTIYAYNTTNGLILNPPRIPNPQTHAQQTGFRWNNTGLRPYWVENENSCRYCHGRSYNEAYGLGRIRSFMGNNQINGTINSTSYWCSACHVNTSTQNYTNMVNVFNYSFGVVPPEITGSTWKSNRSGYDDHNNTSKINKSDSSTYSDEKCYFCHGGNILQSAGLDILLHNVSQGQDGGPDCIGCHNSAIGGGKQVNFTAMNGTEAVHKDLNSNASNGGLSDENKKCWACHGDGSQPSGHPARYKTPSNCADCHINSSIPFAALQVSQHYWNGTSIASAATTSCYDCHNKSEMMLGANLDPDGAGSVYGGANGGSGSSSHYGKKRADYKNMQDTNNYCYSCHNNVSAVFPFIDNNNKTINNHSVNYPSTNPDCADCHFTGRLHDSTLTNPTFSLSNSTLCEGCHGLTGSAVIKNKEKHNGSVECSQCHLNSTRSIHPVRYLNQDRISWDTSNTSAVNCTNCHQSGFENAPIIPYPSKHSNNLSNGSLWNNTTYWTSEASSCSYCHDNTSHNSTALGAINILLTDINNTRKGQISTTTWCADCHYNDASNSNYKGNLWNPIPPLITENNTNKDYWINHSSYLNSGYRDNVCETCHAINGSSSLDSMNYSHSLDEGVAGGPDCISCHNTELGGGKQVNFIAMNDSNSIHKNLNSNASNGGLSDENKKCWACHGDGTKPTSGHPDNYKTPYNCDQCHVPGVGQNLNFTPTDTLLNVTAHYWNSTNIGTAAITTCYDCHNTSEMMLGANLDPDGAGSVYGGINGGSNSVSHYGKKRADYKNMQDTNNYCYSCHNNVSAVFPFIDNNNKTIANHSVNYPSTSPDCADCHFTGRLHDSTLTNPTFSLSNSTLCEGCHGLSGSAAIKNKEKHNSTMECSQCHLNSTRNIHPVQYLKQDRISWETSKTNAVNCTDCHQSGFSNAPIIPDPLKHSNNLSNGSLWNNTPYWTSGTDSCYYCHNDTKHGSNALGKISILLSDLNNTRKGQLTITSWCADCHYNDALNTNYKGDYWNPIPPLITENNTGKDYWINHSGYIGSGYKDDVCGNCHAINGSSSLDSNNYSHSLNEGTVGGPDCISCHSVAIGGGKQVNFTAMNNSGSIHKNLNSNASNGGLSDENKKCWACHGNGSKPLVGHPSNFKSPYKCENCHIPGPSQNLNFTPASTILNISQHFWNGTSINTTAITTCYDCHNTSEMMLGTNLDPDGAGSIYGGANGGSGSTSHYGKKRPDYQSIQDTNDYCTRCHNNASTIFPFTDNNNKTIANHSVNYPSTNPNCSDCHLTGRLHDSTLTNPTFSLSNSTLCEGCHGLSGSAAIKDKEKHNSTMECSQCHLNSTRNIHPVQYLKQDRISWETSKTNAVNCTDCHQSGFSNAPIIPDPLKHSNNLSNGSLWNSTPYWTSGTDSCYYCHNDTKHNSSALGRISLLLTDPNNTRKGDLTTTTWCADCHYSDASNSNYKGDYWNPIPPLITENNTGKDYWINHSGYLSSGYKDKSCENCHAIIGNSSKDSNNYSHSLGAGTGGGPDCTFCHEIGGLAPKTVNITDFRMSIHKNLNGADTDVNRSCYACHGDGNAPESGHPVEYKTPKKCADCHSQGNYSARIIQNHIPPKLPNDPGRIISTNAYCTDCHNNSINNFAYTRNGSVSHYVTNTSILKPTVNRTNLPVFGFFTASDASDHNKECNNCHKNYPFNQTYGNATQIEYGHTSTAACDQCHVTMNASGLHDGSLIVPQTFNCLDCHSTNASKYNAPNISGTTMAAYPATSCESSGCHGQGVTNGLLDTLNKHNIDRNFSGTPGTAGTVYLNGQTAITVTSGAQVTVASTINDISGGSYYASRAGGAEYYIDSDPGIGKGIALNATDGYYDAVNGAWENVTGTIDTTDLSVGTHTIHVRGMDIGKQWSASSNAILTIKSGISYIPSVPVSLTNAQGNFWINHTWQAGTGNITDSFNISVNGSWVNGTSINYSNNSVQPHGWSNISVWAYNNSGNGSLSLTAASDNIPIANNNPVIAWIGNRTVAEGSLLTFTVSATDIDSDILVNATSATKGIFDPATGQFTWTPGYTDQGIYIWNFNSSDNFGGTTDQTITVTVINIPLSITSSIPVTDPTSTE
ncbi:MAG: hypothetical protein FIB07_02845, partial [Candidatus Methanoperedens sp.]|nr:hypothetical protein [Candidatus Methanoperedens sp.]